MKNEHQWRLLLLTVLFLRLVFQIDYWWQVSREIKGLVKLRNQTRTWLRWRTWWQSQGLRMRRDLVLVNKQVHLLSLLVKHPQVPWPAKITGGCAIGYLFSPIQLIPSFIPILGQMDDLMVLYLGTRVVRKFAPAAVLNQCEALADRASSAQIERWEHTLRDLRQSKALAA